MTNAKHHLIVGFLVAAVVYLAAPRFLCDTFCCVSSPLGIPLTSLFLDSDRSTNQSPSAANPPSQAVKMTDASIGDITIALTDMEGKIVRTVPYTITAIDITNQTR